MMVVDACYNHDGGEDWCGRLKDEWGSDKRGCEFHFDIQTDEYRNDVDAKGKDGVVWKRESHQSFLVMHPQRVSIPLEPPRPMNVQKRKQADET